MPEVVVTFKVGNFQAQTKAVGFISRAFVLRLGTNLFKRRLNLAMLCFQVLCFLVGLPSAACELKY